MVRPPKVSPDAETRLTVLPPWLTPTWAAPMVSGSVPNSLVKMTRTWGRRWKCAQSRAGSCRLCRRRSSGGDQALLQGRPELREQVLESASALLPVRKRRIQRAERRRARQPSRLRLGRYSRRKGAVAQVPTQWSGGGGAAAAETERASRAMAGRMERRRRVVTAECQPRKDFFSGSILRCFITARRGGVGDHGSVSRIVAMRIRQLLAVSFLLLAED